MGFLNRHLLIYALLLVALTLAFKYVNIHFFEGTGRKAIWLAVAYLFLIVISAVFLIRSDKSNNWSGFSYHLTTYIILISNAALGVNREDYEYLKDELKHLLLFVMAVWGIGLMLHTAMHFFRKRRMMQKSIN